MVEMIAQVLIPISMLFALGFLINRRRFTWVVYGVMTLGMLCLLIPTLVTEVHGNPAIAQLGVSQPTGAMGRQRGSIRTAGIGLLEHCHDHYLDGFGQLMHDSSMALSGTMELLGMMTNAFYGGGGVGFLNYYYYLIIAVFISGLMVGRTPELFGRKVEHAKSRLPRL